MQGEEHDPSSVLSSTGSLRAQQTVLSQPGQVWVFAVKLSMLRGGGIEAQDITALSRGISVWKP